MPQPPQLFGSKAVLTQATPQHCSPPEQPVLWQVLAWQEPETQLCPVGQAWPQVPQLVGSVLRLASQPSPYLWSQSAKPGSQERMVHAAAVQPVTAWLSGAQKMPQPPQLLGSPLVLAQVAPQHVSPPGHALPGPQGPTQRPPEQVSPGAQALPQPPQFCGSVLVSTSQPSWTCLSQSAKPTTHAAMVQVEPEQRGVAFARGPQGMPQPPQLFGSPVVSTQSGLQQVRPLPQVWPPPQLPTHSKSTH